MLLGVDGSVYIPHTSDPLKRPGLDSHKANKIGLSFMSTLSNTHTNLLAHNALLRRALTTHDTTVRMVALLGTLLTLIGLSLLLW